MARREKCVFRAEEREKSRRDKAVAVRMKEDSLQSFYSMHKLWEMRKCIFVLFCVYSADLLKCEWLMCLLAHG